MARWGADGRLTDLVERYGAELTRFAILVTGSRADGEDVMQEALLAASRAWPRVRERSDARAYLRTAIVRKHIDAQRRRRDVPLGQLPDRAVDELGFLRHEQDRAFFRLLRDVPPGQRAVLVLRYYDDFADADIARVLGCTEATVRSQAHRGLAALRVSSLAVEAVGEGTVGDA